MNRSLAAFVIACLSLPAIRASAQTEAPLSTGQTLYLPIYSQLRSGDVDKAGKPRETALASQISLRNTDPRQPVRILSARLIDAHGKPVREFLAAAEAIPPLGSHELFVPRADAAGAAGATFLIVWTADVPVNPVLVEALHADSREGRSLVFVTTALPIRAR